MIYNDIFLISCTFLFYYTACGKPPSNIVGGKVNIPKNTCVEKFDEFDIVCDCNWFKDGAAVVKCDPAGTWQIDGSCRGIKYLFY